MEKVFAGARLRRLRNERGLSQVDLARMLAVSPSYLNQIEHDSRPLTVTVLVRLTEVFGIDPAFFTPHDSEHQVAELREALAAGAVPLADIQDLVRQLPEVASAVIELHHRHRDAVEHLGTLTDARTAAPSAAPHEQVRDFFYAHQNHFDELDRAAERIAKAVGTRRREVRRRLRDHLADVHDLRIETADARADDTGTQHEYDPTTRTLVFSPMLRGGQQAFRMATELAHLECSDLIESVLAEEQWHDERTRELARIGLANYFAGAFILPYTPILRAAETMRYDLELLSTHFGVSYETIAHRLSTLQRPGARGVPFIFVRVDRAGNISKRQSATGFHFSRSGGTCPLWNVYETFGAPGRVLRQVAEMPDGQRYLWVSRAQTRGRAGFGRPTKTFAIGLGCELRHAGRLVYSDGLRIDEQTSVMPIGPGCKMCPRESCPQRAAPAIGQELTIWPHRSSYLPYGVG